MRQRTPLPRGGRVQRFSRDQNPRERIPVLRERTGQGGEVLVTWAVWGLVALAVLLTYSRLEPSELYNVSEDGLAGGLGRVLVLLNFPVALVAIAVALPSVAVLPRAAWWAAGPTFALCAVVPAVVDQDDLDAGWGNALPALGVLVALALTVAATRRVGTPFAPRLPGDRLRALVAVVVFVLSLPWVAAELGFLAYGAVNFAQDLWFEQVVKRGWTEASIPSALVPGPRPIWVVIVALAALATVVLVRESNRVETAPAI